MAFLDLQVDATLKSIFASFTANDEDAYEFDYEGRPKTYENAHKMIKDVFRFVGKRAK